MRAVIRSSFTKAIIPAAIGLLALTTAAVAAQPSATVVEFHNVRLDHYFLTADAAEAAMLDAGTLVPGWKRTGVTFRAFAHESENPAALPVCRFFGTPERGPDSHFYTASPAECALVKTNPDWQYESIAFHIEIPDGTGRCPATTQPIYRSFWPGQSVRASNHRFVPDLTVHAKMAPASLLEGVVMCAPLSAVDQDADAVRLLEQSTFGPTDALIAEVQANGAAAFVDAQLALSSSRYSVLSPVPEQRAATCINDRTPPLRPDSYCARDNYSLFVPQREFFGNALAAPDQLRQRVAFALSQLLVTSGFEIRTAYAMQRYQQLLADLAFDNFEKLLTEVTLSPAMGRYLDMANNAKANPATGTQPNENYARELLQLFSIGTVELKPDGTPLVDAQGRTIPTYEQEEIVAFSRVLTGWTYPTAPGASARAFNPRYFDGRMEERAGAHDFGTKTLTQGAVAAANLPMSQDLAFAIRNIFTHPNTGPFIAKQLIQKLVTGDPSPGYVGRVAAVFANNGSGLRGDLKATVRAILLDPEARGPAKFDAAYGKLREPAQLVTNVMRLLAAKSDGVLPLALTPAMGQPLFYAASVFNYYPPDYVVPGTTVLGPEFGIQNTDSTLARINALAALAFMPSFPPDATVYGATGTQLDWSALVAVAGDTEALLARLDRLMLHGTMSAASRSAIATALDALPPTDAANRARTAFYLVAASSQYQVQR
jgi:uncharacterized protein (DUF1800 family)